MTSSTFDMKLELVPVPVTDVDRAKDFYVRVGFIADHDRTVHEGLRFVQLTPPGSAGSPMPASRSPFARSPQPSPSSPGMTATGRCQKRSTGRRSRRARR